MATEWYYARQGQQHGPISFAELKQSIQQGKVSRTDLVWCDGMAEWTAAGKLQALAAIFPAPQAAAPLAATPSAAAPVAAHPTSPVVQPAQQAQAPQTIAYANPRGNTGGAVMLTPQAMEILRGTKPWTRFIGILLFIVAGLLGLAGLFVMILGLGARMSGPRGAGLAGGMGLVLGLIYLVAAALYFFPALFLNQFASRVATLIAQPNERSLEGALTAQRAFWRFVGIAVLIVLCLYLVALILALGLGAAATMR